MHVISTNAVVTTHWLSTSVDAALNIVIAMRASLPVELTGGNPVPYTCTTSPPPVDSRSVLPPQADVFAHTIRVSVGALAASAE